MALTAVTTSATLAAPPSPTTVQVSVTTGGFAPGRGANDGGRSAERRLVSDDGRYVVFEASGPVVPGQKPTEWQIVRRDRHLGTTTLISQSTAGKVGNARSGSPSISADGHVVAFHSYASNLVPGDTNGQSDVFTHDVRTGKTTRASATNSGGQVSVNGGTNIVGPPSMSADGRYVGFTSHAQGLAPGDTANTNAYLHDRQNGAIEVVSRSTSNLVVDVMPSSTVSVGDGGNIISFHSGNSSVVPGDSNLDPDVFVRNRSAGTTVMVPSGEDGSSNHTMSANGRFVAFVSRSDNLVPGDSNAKDDVFVHDRVTGTRQRVSIATGGGQANAHSSRPSISKDGRYVTFVTGATNLVTGDTNGQDDAFRHDRITGKTIRVSVAANGAQNGYSSRSPAISGDGQHVTFESHGRTLTKVNTQGYGQVFVRDLTGKWPALHARIGTLPGKVKPSANHRIATRDIRTGPALKITWAPRGKTKGKVVRQNATVSGNRFVLGSPKRPGTYAVTVKYEGNTVRSRTIAVIKPTAKKLPASIKKGKKLVVRTAGLSVGQQIQVRFKPSGTTKGAVVKRKAKVNKKGVAKVATTSRRGTYKVTVRAQGATLRKGSLRIT